MQKVGGSSAQRCEKIRPKAVLNDDWLIVMLCYVHNTPPGMESEPDYCRQTPTTFWLGFKSTEVWTVKTTKIYRIWSL